MEQDRDRGGQVVRNVWITWAKEQPYTKPSWLEPYNKLSEPDQEVDRRIYEGCVTDYKESQEYKSLVHRVDLALNLLNYVINQLPRAEQEKARRAQQDILK